MPGEDNRDWRELCDAAVEATDRRELLLILSELDRALEREQRSRELRNACRSQEEERR